MTKGILYKLIISLILLAFSLSLCPLFFVRGSFFGGYFTAFCSVWLIIVIVNLFYINTRKITFMFNAMENDDFSFQFSEKIRSDVDRMFNQSLNRIIGLIYDTKKAIMQQDKYYEIILDQATCGIIVFDPKTGIVFQTNNSANNMFGIGMLSHINQLSIVSKDIPKALIAIEKGKNENISFYNETKKVCLALSCTMSILNKRELKIVSMNDIGTEMDDTQTDSWMRLSRVLTHEIMNSLAPITSLSEQLRSTKDPDIIQNGLSIISDTSKGLVDFVDNYRRLTRIPVPVKEDFSLIALLKTQLELFNSDIDISKVNPEIRLFADRNLISQVLVNLLKNAVEAASDSQRVWVDAYYNDKGKIVVDVCNIGEKISEELLDNIFVPFFTTKTGGSGIGLSLSRQIMRLHDGTVNCISKTKDNKNVTVFSLSF